MSESVEKADICEQVLRRMLETDGECRAAIWLRNTRSGQWYEWGTCNSDPGHEGAHCVWSERDSTDWAEWEDGERATSRYVDLVAAEREQRTEPSPWNRDELAYLERVRANV